MIFQYDCYTDIGKRDNNEDSLGLVTGEQSIIAIVADGLGGHSNGEVASRMAVETVLKAVAQKEHDEEELLYAIWQANDAICNARLSGHTTLAALWINKSNGIAAHIGDSRIYQFRNGKIIFQSRDHSVVQMAVLVGEISQDEVRSHKDRNKVFRVLGEPGEKPKIDSTELDVQPGDRFLLCSDGFWEPVLESDMLRTLSETSTANAWLQAMRQIIRNAQNPKQDNNTAICIIVK